MTTRDHAAEAGNRAKLLRLLRENGPMHRAELARRSGLSRATVASVVSPLIANGTLVRMEPPPERATARGRPGELLSLRADEGRVIGLAFTYDEVRVVVTDYAHQVIAELAEPLPRAQAWTLDLDDGVRLVRAAMQEADVDPSKVLGVGLGVPGPVDARRGVASASSSTTWLGTIPGTEAADRLGLPVVLDNSARLSLLAEARWGAAANYRNVIYVKLSSGVGGGFLLDGQVLRGRAGAAGEIGHACVEPGGRACRCGGRGCLEAYASVPALIETLQRSLGAAIDLDHAVELAEHGDPIVERIVVEAGQLVGTAVASAVNLFNPEVVVIGGELTRFGDLLITPIREAVAGQALRLAREDLQVVLAAFTREAAALGGVALVLREEELLLPPRSTARARRALARRDPKPTRPKAINP